MNRYNFTEESIWEETDEYFRLKRKTYGLPVDLLLDEVGMYKFCNHPLVVFFRNSYDSDEHNYIPVSVSDKPEIVFNKKINITEEDIHIIFEWIKKYKDYIIKIADYVLRPRDLYEVAAIKPRNKKLSEGYFSGIESHTNDDITDDIVHSDLYYSNITSRIYSTLGLTEQKIREIYQKGSLPEFSNGVDLSECYYIFNETPKTINKKKYFNNVLINTIAYHILECYPGDLQKDVAMFNKYLLKINNVNEINTELDKLSYSLKDCEKAFKMMTDTIIKNFVINPKLTYNESEMKLLMSWNGYSETFYKLPQKFKEMIYTLCNFKFFKMMLNLYTFVEEQLYPEDYLNYAWVDDYLDEYGQIIHIEYEDEQITNEWCASLLKRSEKEMNIKYELPVFNSKWLFNDFIKCGDQYKCLEKIRICMEFLYNLYELFFFRYNWHRYFDLYAL